MLKTKKISLGYPHKQIIYQVSLNLPDQKISVIIGANGCGKSTLLKSLARLLLPMDGRALLAEQDIYAQNGKQFAQKVALLSQSSSVTENLSVAQLVRYGRYPYQSYFSRWTDEDEAQVQQALALTQTLDIAQHSIENLSGGQRQRAWIAMVLAQNTPYILLDEPTTYLDLTYQIEVLDLLKKLNQQQNKTIVMILHDLNLVCRYADHIVALKEGKVFAEGTAAEVMTEENIQQVFNLRSKIITDPVHQVPMCIPLSGG